jgi:hypothetical protein
LDQRHESSRGSSEYPTLKPGHLEPFFLFWARHALAGAVLVPLALSSIFVIRCLAVTNADFNTAKVLIRSSTLNEALLAILLGVLPFVGLVVSTIVGMLVGESIRSRGIENVRTLMYYVLGLVVVIGPVLVARSKSLQSYNYWSYHLTFAVAVACGYILTIRVRDAELKKRQMRIAIYLAGCGLILGLFGINAITSREMWLPLERVELKSGQSIAGYILRFDGDDVIILDERTRLASIVGKSDVKSRQLCSGKGNHCSAPVSPQPSLTP